ncbi:MAG: FAD-dependent oxidoreductase [Actinomycetota bacterium]|nr:FAD-dependent oxidoreductase [Actinomycetota bacterium]
MRFTQVEAGGEWFDANVPCTQACPVLTNAGRYVAAIAAGDDGLAYDIARLPNPFASICGRVCAAPCEIACRRGAIDQPIAIRALKRYVCERFGVESETGAAAYAAAAPRAPVRDERVAIVGAGPAGLACAHDLATYGYRPVVFEAQREPGGMMVLGIPPYRLRRDLLDAEIKAILDMGVELRTGLRLGEDFSLASLKQEGFASVFLGIGAMRSRDLQIPGVDLDGVLRAVDFLLNVNLGYRVELGDDVVVVGGGNVALDAARSALREIAAGRSTPSAGVDRVAETEAETQAEADAAGAATAAALDVARTAVRLGARRVRCVTLESRVEMPASEFEIEEAEVEGIELLHHLGPKRILGADHVEGLETIDVASVFDVDGRFNPSFVDGTEETITCDSVILAIGQTADLSWLEPDDGVETTRRGTVTVDTETMATTAEGVYAGGDLAYGPRNLIDAIADGRRAAASIHRQLSGEEPVRPSLSGRRLLPIVAVNRGPRQEEYTERSRLPVPAEPSGRRIGSTEIELGYSEEEARLEAGRCLQCFLNITLEPSLCILCGACVDICPENCIRILPADDILDLVPERPSSVLVLQEELCIRCELCVDRCPTDALFMDSWSEASTAPIALQPVAG